MAERTTDLQHTCSKVSNSLYPRQLFSAILKSCQFQDSAFHQFPPAPCPGKTSFGRGRAPTLQRREAGSGSSENLKCQEQVRTSSCEVRGYTVILPSCYNNWKINKIESRQLVTG